MLRIKKDDQVKVIAGAHKGKVGKVVKVDVKLGKVWIEKINERVRHIRPSQVNPRGGKKDIHVALDASNVAILVDETAGTISKVAYKTTADGNKIRIAKKTGKEIK